jgi:hypothetical protein
MGGRARATTAVVARPAPPVDLSMFSTYRCFGIAIASPVAFPGTWQTPEPDADPTTLADGPLAPWIEPGTEGWSGVCDGEPFVVERSAEGVHRFVHGGRRLFELSSDHRRLVGDLRPETRTIRWWRALLDSVLFTVSLLRGHEALHAGAVRTPEGVVAIAGPSGAGKSTLLAHLTGELGLGLMTDDIAFLVEGEGRSAPLIAPGPPLMTLPNRAEDTRRQSLAEIGDERWVTAPVLATPAPLRRIVFLDRDAGALGRALLEPEPFSTLMRHLLPFPATPPRASARLAIAARLSAEVELVRVQAELTRPVADVAALALSGLSQP